MRISCCHSLSILFLSSLSLLTAPGISAFAANPVPPPKASPQLVRLLYVEGDVRVSRGKLADKEDAKADETATGWEQAAANLPMESGYSLVTGKGRAEVEFEDASTVYLGENSVLTFGELTATTGVPYSEMALLSGVATLDVHTEFPGEHFRMNTPTDHVILTYPQKVYLRVNSYLDSIGLTPMRPVLIASDTPGNYNPNHMAASHATMFYTSGRRQLPPKNYDAAIFSDWDAWVDQRVEAHEATVATVMKDAGLSAPIPGLAEMSGQGHFFACAPYGTCWEPTQGWDGHATNVAMVTAQPGDSGVLPMASAPAAATTGPRPNAPATKMPSPSAADVFLTTHPGATMRTEDYDFPCSDYAVRSLIATDPVTGQEKIIDTELDADAGFFPMAPFPIGYRGSRLGLFMNIGAWGGTAPWDWAVCNTGTWIRWQRHYVWVAGTHRHHHGPYCWVRNGRNIGYVPIHPRDVAGKPPINLKDGLFKWTGKQGAPVERVAFEQDKDLKILDAPPKELRRFELQPLKSAEVPHAEGLSAYQVASLNRPSPIGKSSMAGAAVPHGTVVAALGTAGHDLRGQGTPISFDRKSQSFMVSREVNQAGHSSMVIQPLVGRGTTVQPINSRSPASRTVTGPGNSSGFRSSGSGNSGGGGATRSASPSFSNGGGGAGRSYSAPSFSGGSGGGGGGASHSSAPSSGSSSGSAAHH